MKKKMSWKFITIMSGIGAILAALVIRFRGNIRHVFKNNKISVR